MKNVKRRLEKKKAEKGAVYCDHSKSEKVSVVMMIVVFVVQTSMKETSLRMENHSYIRY